MTISRGVYNQLFEQAPDAADGSKEKVIRLHPTEAKAGAVVMSAKNKIQMWTKDEHDRFLAALEKFPAGPWKKVADFIGTKTPRQTMTHAQKYRQKIHRRQRGLRNQKKSVNNDTNNVNNSSTDNPTPKDAKEDVKDEPNGIGVPFNAAELQGSTAAMAEVTGATNDQLLNILAQQATTIHDKPEAMEVDEVEQGTVEMDATVALETAAGEDTDGSFNNNLPSLAEILHLGGAEGQAAVETEETESPSTGDVAELTTETEVKTETETETKEEEEVQMGPEDCKCKCTCSAHGGKKAVVEASMTQPRPEES